MTTLTTATASTSIPSYYQALEPSLCVQLRDGRHQLVPLRQLVELFGALPADPQQLRSMLAMVLEPMPLWHSDPSYNWKRRR